MPEKKTVVSIEEEKSDKNRKGETSKDIRKVDQNTESLFLGLNLVPYASTSGECEKIVEEEIECEFVKRMIARAYQDKKFEDAAVITDWSLCHKKANRHAATLVIQTIIKIMSKIVEVIKEILQRAGNKSIKKLDVEKIYA